MAQFMLLLHESPDDFAGLSPDEIQRVIREYTAWRMKLQEQGKLAGGLKLKNEGGRRLTRDDGQSASVILTELMTTSSTGRSPAPVGTDCMAATTSRPLTTLPNSE